MNNENDLVNEILEIYEDSQYKLNCRLQIKRWLERRLKKSLFWDDNEAAEANVENGLIDNRTVIDE